MGKHLRKRNQLLLECIESAQLLATCRFQWRLAKSLSANNLEVLAVRPWELFCDLYSSKL